MGSKNKEKNIENAGNDQHSSKASWVAPKLLELESDQTQTAKSMVNMVSPNEILSYGSTVS